MYILKLVKCVLSLPVWTYRAIADTNFKQKFQNYSDTLSFFPKFPLFLNVWNLQVYIGPPTWGICSDSCSGRPLGAPPPSPPPCCVPKQVIYALALVPCPRFPSPLPGAPFHSHYCRWLLPLVPHALPVTVTLHLLTLIMPILSCFKWLRRFLTVSMEK